MNYASSEEEGEWVREKGRERKTDVEALGSWLARARLSIKFDSESFAFFSLERGEIVFG